MPGKKIFELDAASTFVSGDLLLVRKSGLPEDSKISQPDFIKSIGNTAVEGFIATSTNPNEIKLLAANGITVDTYYEGMIISFISPIATTGLVKVQIGALGLIDLYQYNTSTTVILAVDDYVTAVYKAGKFYQTNIVTNNIYSNEYIAVGTVAPDLSNTKYVLTSAIGVSKTSYYDGMTATFVPKIASKGAVTVNIDGLGEKSLVDEVGDNIPNDLAVGKAIYAIYDEDSDNFIKFMFSNTVSEVPPIPTNAIDDTTGEIIEANLPAINKCDITVGPTGANFTTIRAAIQGLVEDFGPNGGNKICTITLNNDFVWHEKLELADGNNYSWITIKTQGNINVTVGSLFLFQRTTSPVITGTYTRSSMVAWVFCELANGNVIFKDLTVNGIDSSQINTLFINASLNDNNSIKSTNVVLNNFTQILNGSVQSINIDKLTLNNKTSFNDYLCNISNNSKGTIKELTTNFNASGGIFKMTNNCNLTFNNLISTSPNNVNLTLIIDNSTCSFSNGNIYSGRITYENSSKGSLNNVRVGSSGNVSRLELNTGSRVSVIGGNYRDINSQEGSADIIARNAGTVLYIRNNPLGSVSINSPAVQN